MISTGFPGEHRMQVLLANTSISKKKKNYLEYITSFQHQDEKQLF